VEDRVEETPVDQLGRALKVSDQLIAGVRPEQWASATPCSEWTVKDLVAHLIVGNRRFTAALRSEEPAASGAGGADTSLEDDPLGAYRGSVRALLEAFALPGVMERMVTVPFGTVPGVVAWHLRMTEALTHGWDLARATGQDVEAPDDLVEQELAFTGRALADIPPERRPFAPSRPVDDDAPPLDRLAALLGRDPG
jgi:uncharacterized protein (TIGR03086 family)